jgi:hypothetical protein
MQTFPRPKGALGTGCQSAAFAWMRQCDSGGAVPARAAASSASPPPAVRRPEGLALVRPESLPHAGPSWISVTAPNGVVTRRVQVHRDGQRLLIGEVGETRPRRVGDPGRGHCRRWHTYSNLYWVGGLTCRLLRSTCANRAGVSLGATCPRERTQCPPAPAAGAAKSSGYGTALHRRNSNRREAKHE